MRIQEASADGKVCAFSVSGSVTGADGAGVSTNRFVSNSGRVVFEPDDWNVAYAAKVFHRSLPAGSEVKWKAVLHGQDRVAAPKATGGAENAVTVAMGLPAAEHTLELRGRNLQEFISAVRIYAPGIGRK